MPWSVWLIKRRFIHFSFIYLHSLHFRSWTRTTVRKIHANRSCKCFDRGANQHTTRKGKNFSFLQNQRPLPLSDRVITPKKRQRTRAEKLTLPQRIKKWERTKSSPSFEIKLSPGKKYMGSRGYFWEREGSFAVGRRRLFAGRNFWSIDINGSSADAKPITKCKR